MTFMSLGCMVCHKGEGVGGGMYQSLGFAVSVPPVSTRSTTTSVRRSAAASSTEPESGTIS